MICVYFWTKTKKFDRLIIGDNENGYHKNITIIEKGMLINIVVNIFIFCYAKCLPDEIWP